MSIDLDRVEGLVGYADIPGDWVLQLIAEVRALRERDRLARNVVLYADSICGMLRECGWSGKAEALESRIKAVIDFDKENA